MAKLSPNSLYIARKDEIKLLVYIEIAMVDPKVIIAILGQMRFAGA